MAIRFLEAGTTGKPFVSLTIKDFAAVRDELKKRAYWASEDAFSASTIRHYISHLKALFGWVHIDIKYTPHSAKHTIGAERDIRQLNAEERKAWSPNMGHDSGQITDLHYAKMSDDRRFEVLEGLDDRKTIDPKSLSDSQKQEVADAIIKVFAQISARN